MRKIFKPFHLTVETLSPLHIGSGKDLHLEVDYLYSKNQILVMNLDKVLEIAKERVFETKEYQLSKILQPHQYEDCIIYKANHKAKELPSTIAEFIKDVNWKPYLPGSSLKGAFRTILASEAYQGPLSHYLLSPEQEEDKPEKADDEIEKRLFGRDSYFDILKALKVKDCYLKGPSSIEVVNARVYSLQRTEQRTDLQPRRARRFIEVVPKGTVFEGEIVIEEFLFSELAERELGFSKRPVKIHLLCQYGRQMAKRIIENEKGFYRNVRRREMISFYESLEQELSTKLRPNQFLFQIGWGTGWQSKTIGSKLTKPEVGMIVEKYFKGKLIDTFPRSRRLVEYPDGLFPLGWVKINMEEKG